MDFATGPNVLFSNHMYIPFFLTLLDTCIDLYMFTYLPVFRSVHVLYIYIYIYIYMCVCIHIYMCVCVCYIMCVCARECVYRLQCLDYAIMKITLISHFIWLFLPKLHENILKYHRLDLFQEIAIVSTAPSGQLQNLLQAFVMISLDW